MLWAHANQGSHVNLGLTWAGSNRPHLHEQIVRIYVDPNGVHIQFNGFVFLGSHAEGGYQAPAPTNRVRRSGPSTVG